MGIKYLHNKKLKINPVDDTIVRSYQLSEKIIKDNSSFYLGILFTKKKYRHALYAIYAWMREIDDIADNEKDSLKLRERKLEEFHKLTLQLIHNKIPIPSNLKDSFWPAFCDTVQNSHISERLLLDMISCQQQDLFKYDYSTYDELYEYCRRAASTIGLIFITIFGYDGGQKSERLAALCGVAFQLTNILRDVQEDLRLGRVYLPANWIEVSVLNSKNFQDMPHEKIMSGVEKLIDKANLYYQESMLLCPKLHDGKLSFLILVNVYQTLFEKIRKNPVSIFFNTKIRLTKREKIQAIFKAFYHYFYFMLTKTSST